MHTLFLFAIAWPSREYLAFLVVLAPVCLILFLKYRDWKPVFDLERAMLAKSRILGEDVRPKDYPINYLREAKVLLRYCRVYQRPLSTFDLTEDELIRKVEEGINWGPGRYDSSVWEKARRELASYYLRHG